MNRTKVFKVQLNSQIVIFIKRNAEDSDQFKSEMW